jgi:Domain of unknown function (DUF4347)
MGMILDVISGPNLVTMVTDNIAKAIDLSGMGVSQFFAAVQSKAGNNKISVLRIWGHGVTHYVETRKQSDGGFIRESDGGVMRFETPYNKGNLKIGDDQIDADTVDTYEQSLNVITKLFEPKVSRVELRGCQAALGTGQNMMLRLAEIWQTEVQGSDRSQPMMIWVPPVFSARPGGTKPPLPKATIVEYNDKSLKR